MKWAAKISNGREKMAAKTRGCSGVLVSPCFFLVPVFKKSESFPQKRKGPKISGSINFIRDKAIGNQEIEDSRKQINDCLMAGFQVVPNFKGNTAMKQHRPKGISPTSA